MSDVSTVSMLLDFIVQIAVGLYSIVFSYWFIALPVFTYFAVTLCLIIIRGIVPNSANRKH